LFGRDADMKPKGPTLVSVSDRLSGGEVTQPLQFGSHKSPLIRTLLDDELHRKESQLSEQEWIALVTWVDLNAPYYDTFYNRRPSSGDEPVRDVVVEYPEPFGS
jgi:hypothetical protein